MRNRPRLHLLALGVAVAAELCALGLLAVSGWYLAACALAGLGLLATFSYPTPSGLVRLLALGRIGTGYGQNVLLHRAALAETTRARLRVFDDLAATGARPVDDRTIDRLLTDAEDEGQRVLRVTAPLVVTGSAILTALLVILVVAPPAAAPLLVGAAVLLILALVPTGIDSGHGRLRAEVLASIDAAPELDSLGAAPLLRERILAQLDDLAAEERRRQSRQARRRVVSGLAAGLAFAAVIVVSAAVLRVGATSVGGSETTGSDLGSVPLFVMIVCLAFGVLERAYALGDLVPHLGRLRGIRVRRGGSPSAHHTSSAAVDVGADGSITVGYGEAAEQTAREEPVTIPAGATAALVGPSGVGKSTLLAALAEAVRASGTRDSDAHPGAVALVADDEFLFTGTIGGNLRLGAGRPLSADEIDAVLAALGLSADIGADTRTGLGGRALSRGEMRRLAIARAVLSEPDVLLVDEPDLGLDPETLSTLLGFIRTRLPAATIVYAAHESPRGATHVLDLGERMTSDSGARGWLHLGDGPFVRSDAGDTGRVRG